MKYYVQVDTDSETGGVMDFSSRNPALKKVRELLAMGYHPHHIITNASSLPRSQKIMESYLCH